MILPHSIFRSLVLLILVVSGTGLQLSAESRFAGSSRLATGHWVKVRVDSSAVYQIDYATLQEWGFPDPEAVKIYGYGSLRHNSNLYTDPDDLPQVQTIHENDKIIFYGEGNRRLTLTSSGTKYIVDPSKSRNYYDKASYYFLTDSSTDDQALPANQYYSQSSIVETTHYSLIYRELEEYNFLDAGVFFFSRNIDSSRDFSFDLTDYASDAVLCYTFAAQNYSGSTTLGVTPLDFATITNSSTSTLSRISDEYIKYNYTTSPQYINFIPDGENVTFSFLRPTTSNPNYVGLKSVYVHYRRYNTLHDAAQMTMRYVRSRNYVNIAFTDAPEDLIVWNVTAPDNITACGVNASGSDVQASMYHPTTTDATIVAFSPSRTLPTPQLIGEVKNTDLHSLDNVEYVVITTAMCKDQSERLAAIHREYQGMETAVVVQDDIFNEFSSGAKTPNALRRFLQMLYERGNGRLKYVTLMGASHYDPRELLAPHATEYLIGYEAEALTRARNETSNYASDQYFAILSPDCTPGSANIPVDLAQGNFTLTSDIAVGRLPVTNHIEAEALVDKIERYFTDAAIAGIYNRALFMADQANENEHITHGTEVDAAIMEECAPGSTAFKAYVELYRYNTYSHPYLFSAINNFLSLQPRYLNFSGHHGIGGFGTQTAFLRAAQLPNLTYSSMPILFTASCSAQRHNRAKHELNIDFLLVKDGGAIATIGSTSSAYMESNHKFNQAFTRNYYSASPNDCLGDVYRKSHNEMLQREQAVKVNTFTYNLAGDPGLPVYMPSRRITVSTVNGAAVPTDGPVLSSLVPVNIEGEVTYDDGKIADSFNGTMSITIFEAPHKMKTLAQNAADKVNPPTVTLDETVVATYITDVKNGKWSTEVTIPAVRQLNGTNRVELHAVSDDKLAKIASGTMTISIDGCNDSELADTSGPIIHRMYINTPDTPDGAETGNDVTLHATVSDNESGIALACASLESAPRIYLDDKIISNSGNMFMPAEDGCLEMKLNIHNLTDGRHTLRMHIKDIAGNAAEKELSFIVVTSTAASALLELDNDFTRSAIEISLVHDMENEPANRLVIEDIHGNPIISKENVTFPYTWEATDDIPDGTYSVYAIVRSGRKYTSTPKATFTLLKE